MVERLYPGVYVTEVASGVKPIDGVATSTADTAALQAASRHAGLPHAPDWTNHNDSDPGVTLLQMFAWLSESTLFAARPHPAGRVAHLPAGWGVAQGLAIDGVDTGGSKPRVSPGIALTGEGKPIEPESTTVALRVKKP
ncbi:MAG TPA: hypothetical protein VI032_14915 [Burkholderiaceae bacterium]